MDAFREYLIEGKYDEIVEQINTERANKQANKRSHVVGG
jgi:hypothetical protein